MKDVKVISSTNLLSCGFILGLFTGLFVAIAGKQDKDNEEKSE